MFHCPSWEKLLRAGLIPHSTTLFRLWKGFCASEALLWCLRGPYHSLQPPERGGRKVGVRLFSKAASVRMRGHICKLSHGGFRLDIRRNSFMESVLNIRMDCPGRWWSHHLWRCSRKNRSWQSVLWSSWRSGDQSKVGCNDLRGLSQPKSWSAKYFSTALQTQPIRDLIVVVLLGEFSFSYLRDDVSSQSIRQTLCGLWVPLLLPLCKCDRHNSSRLFVHSELAV